MCLPMTREHNGFNEEPAGERAHAAGPAHGAAPATAGGRGEPSAFDQFRGPGRPTLAGWPSCASRQCARPRAVERSGRDNVGTTRWPGDDESPAPSAARLERHAAHDDGPATMNFSISRARVATVALCRIGDHVLRATRATRLSAGSLLSGKRE